MNTSKTQTKTITQNIPNNRIQNKTAETQTEVPNTEKEDKNTQTTFAKEDLIQSSKTKLPFNIKTKIEKLKILVPLTELVKNDSYIS